MALHRRHLAALAVLALLALAGCSGGPPTKVCAVCENDLTYGNVSDLSVDSSTVTVELRDDGDARVTVRARLQGADVDRLQGDDALTTAVVRDTRADGRTRPAFEGRNLTARVNGTTLVASYRVPGMATRRTGGVWLVETFYTDDDPDQRGYWVGADRMVVRSPEGTVITNRPEGAAVSGRELVWGESADAEEASDYIPRDAYVAYGPDDSLTTDLATRVAVAVDTLAWAGPLTLVVAFLPMGFVGGTQYVLTRRSVGSSSSSLRQRARESGRAVAGGLVTVVALYFGLAATASLSNGAAPLGLLLLGVVPVGLFAATAGVATTRPTLRRTFATALLGWTFGLASMATLGMYASLGAVLAALAVALWALVVCAVGAVVYLLVRRFVADDDPDGGSEGGEPSRV